MENAMTPLPELQTPVDSLEEYAAREGYLAGWIIASVFSHR
jgi:hypothetical protein